MKLISRMRVAWRWVFRRTRTEREMSAELEGFIEAAAADRIRDGIPPEEARRQARTELQGVEQTKERIRSGRPGVGLDTIVRDVRFALRSLRRSPGFTAAALLTLALGIGANTATFSIFDALILKSLPVKDPEGLVALGGGTFHYPFFQLLREQDMFTEVLASSGISEQDVEIDNAVPERVSLSLVSGEYFSVLGVPAVAGRTFTLNEDRVPGEHTVAVLSDGYWQRRFARDPGVIGQSIRIRGTAITIIGVTPPGFFGERVGVAPDLWLPLTMWPRVIPGRDLLQSPGTAWLNIIGRLRPDVSVATADAMLTTLFRAFLSDLFSQSADEDLRREIAEAAVRSFPARTGLSQLRQQFLPPLLVVFGLVAVMLLIACANVANLLLARATGRRREIALRLALGITRFRLIRQLLTENLLLSVVSGTLGTAIAFWGNSILLTLLSANGTAIALDAHIDGRVLAFVVALSVVTTILFGLAPIWQSTRVDLVTAMRSAGGSAPRRFRLGPSLIAGQVALSLVLMMCAALFLRTLSNLRDADLGFQPEQLIMVDVNPAAAGYQGTRYAAVADQLLDTIQSLPGVTSVTFSENGSLMARSSGTDRMRPDDFVLGPEGIPQTSFDFIGPDYFATMGIPLRAGRDILKTDTATAEAVMVINEAMARQFFPDTNPIGRRMLWQLGESQTSLRITGVAADVKHDGGRDEDRLRFYLPYSQLELSRPSWQLASMRIIVRTATEQTIAGPLRQAVQSVDTRVPILSINSMNALHERTIAPERMVATLSALFAAIALTLTCIGLYGLMSYQVARRTNEIGIRMAVGSGAGRVVGLVMRDALRMVLLGTAVGMVAVAGVSRLVEGLLFGVTPNDAMSLAVAVGLMIAVAAIAAYVPARRAAAVDPLVAIRHN